MKNKYSCNTLAIVLNIASSGKRQLVPFNSPASIAGLKQLHNEGLIEPNNNSIHRWELTIKGRLFLIKMQNTGA